MKYELSVLSKKDSSRSFIKEFSKDEFEALIKANVNVQRYLDYDRAWRIFYINVITQKNYLKQLMEHGISKEVEFRQDEFELIRRVLTVNFFNVLSAFYFYGEFCKTNFSRWFGNESAEHNFILNKLSEYFDNYFEYRFFYKLRNFAVHCGLPIQGLFNTRSTDGKVLFVALFNRSFLLDNFSGWGRVVKKDLEEFENDIPIFTTIINFDNMMMKLHREIKNYLLNYMSSSVDLIRNEVGSLISEYYDFSLWSHDGPENLKKRLLDNEPISFEKYNIDTSFLKSI